MHHISNVLNGGAEKIRAITHEGLGTAVNTTLQIHGITQSLAGACMLGEVVRRISAEIFSYPAFSSKLVEQAANLTPDALASAAANITWVPYRSLGSKQLIVSGLGLCALGTLQYRGAQYFLGDVSRVFNRVLSFLPIEVSNKSWNEERKTAFKELKEEGRKVKNEQGSILNKATNLIQAAAIRIPVMTLVASSAIMTLEVCRRGIAVGLKHAGVVLVEPEFAKALSARLPIPAAVSNNFRLGSMDHLPIKQLATSALVTGVVGTALYHVLNYVANERNAFYNGVLATFNVVKLTAANPVEKFKANTLHGQTVADAEAKRLAKV